MQVVIGNVGIQCFSFILKYSLDTPKELVRGMKAQKDYNRTGDGFRSEESKATKM